MPEIADVPERRGLTHALDRWGASHPDLVLTAPLMVYLLLLGAAHALPENWLPGTIALRGVGSLAVVWMFRRHLPPWGKPHWPIAIFGGALIGWGWVCGQAWLDDLGLSGRLSIFPGSKVVADPREALGAGSLLWTTWWVRMTVAITAVPVVEEIFWRAFMLRVLIDWHGFEKVPLGTFTWLSFLGTSLASMLQHPDNWGVSVLCWMAFNGVFYWTRSILCLVLLHGVTNLVLYLIVLRVDDWSFW